MVDFQIALLWLRAMELLVGHAPIMLFSELEAEGLFGSYRSPYKA